MKVTTKTPWKAFPAYLYLEGRAGIMAPAQMNNAATCATNMIGTGPFKLNTPSDWKVNESLKVVKNPDYWRKDAKGKALPCANSITFVPIPDSPTCDTQLLGGQLDIMHTSSSQSIDKLSTTPGIDVVREKPGNRETRIYQINATKAPFNDPDARLASGYAIDAKTINQIRNKGLNTLAHQTMDSKSPGYLKKNGFPKYNLKKAQELVDKVKAANGGTFDVTLLTTTDSDNSQEGQLLIEQLQKAGMNAKMNQVDQSSLVTTCSAGTSRSRSCATSTATPPSATRRTTCGSRRVRSTSRSSTTRPCRQPWTKAAPPPTTPRSKRRTRTSTWPWPRASTTSRPGTPNGPWPRRA